MYKVRNKLNQGVPVHVKIDGVLKQVTIPAKSSIEIDELTPMISNLANNHGVLKINEVKETKATRSRKKVEEVTQDAEERNGDN